MNNYVDVAVILLCTTITLYLKLDVPCTSITITIFLILLHLIFLPHQIGNNLLPYMLVSAVFLT